MDYKDLIMQILREKQLSPSIDEDGDIVFKYQLKTLFFMTGEEQLERHFLHLFFNCFHDIEEGDEALELAICNKVTRDTTYLKLFVMPEGKSVSASVELCFVDEASLREDIDTALRLISSVRPRYREVRAEFES